uniref:Uncharacterized protein n=1 Tax=Rhizoctonia cerealis hypovirus TaxID=3068667 RepID=A0AA51GJX2_9VIRU|nr:MAG: hypothetical protein [Rhizoctonia cerealis hypovirus]
MVCIANMLGLFSCKARLNPSRASFFSRVFSYLFCFCTPKQIRKIDNPLQIKTALAKAKTQANKEKREKEKQLKALKKRSAIIIQKAYRKHRLLCFIDKYLEMNKLAIYISPFIKAWKHKREQRLASRKFRFELSLRRQKLKLHIATLLQQAKAIELGNKARREFNLFKSFIIKIQTVARRYNSRNVLQELRWQQREARAKVYPAMSSLLFSNVNFKKTGDLDLMDHITPVSSDTKLYIKSDLLSFPKGIPHLSQQTFEANFSRLQHNRGIYFPKVWIIDSFIKHTCPIGLYLVHFNPDHSILPIKFTSIWNGEIIVYVSKMREIQLRKTFNSNKRPVQSTNEIPKLDFRLIQQLTTDDKNAASKSGLNVCAPSFVMAPKTESSLRFEPYIITKKNQSKKKARQNYFYLPMPPNNDGTFIVPFCTLSDHIFLNKSI